MFLPTNETDAILVIGDKMLNVNKAFLSFHSTYFSALFSSNYKEGQMSEIELKDVSYENFALLLGTIYPNTIFPNDKTVYKILDMADRFILPSAIWHVEYHLLNNTRIRNEMLMWLADRYGMTKLLEKSIRRMNSVESAKKLKASQEYSKLSNDSKAKVLDRLMDLI